MQKRTITSASAVTNLAHLLVTAIVVVTLGGCANAPVPINYAPSSVKTATGALSVSDFKYLPAEPTAMKPIPANLIRNTALGEVKIDRDVKVLVRDAVFSELRFVGVQTNNLSKVLSGEIEEFLIDDLGYNIDWTLRVKYFITDATSKKVLFESVKNTQRKTAKFANAFGALNETIKLNVESLMDDAEFVKTIN